MANLCRRRRQARGLLNELRKPIYNGERFIRVYQLIWIVIVMGFLSSIFGCGKQAQQIAANVSQYQQSDIYRDLRKQVLQQTYEKTLATGTSAEPTAVLMETGYPEAIATLMAAADGTTSLYFSNGGGIIGGGDHEAVRAAAASFLKLAPTFANEMRPTEAFPLPSEGSVRFYVVNGDVVRTAEAVEDDLGNMRHQLSPLFHKGHEVIAAIREYTPQSN
jgi:hypothetical protein